MRARIVIFLAVALLIGALACLFYDSWLRPLDRVIGPCLVGLLFAGMIAFGKSWGIRAMGVVFLGLMALALPVSSFRQTLELRNDTSENLQVEVRRRTGDRVKVLKIERGQSRRFVYISGDGDRSVNIPVTLRLESESGKRGELVPLDLPLATNPPPLSLNAIWQGKQ